MKLSMRFPIQAVLLLVFTFLAACNGNSSQKTEIAPAKQDNFGILPEAKITQTAHYKIYSTASDDQTGKVSHAVEALYQSYIGYFDSKEHSRELELVLYRDRTQFRAYNRSSPWAEAYYRTPRCYAYFAEGSNPYHWMIHEATHQLLRELSGHKPAKWINEGVASYFGASQVVGARLQRGRIDYAAYPIWWLSSLGLSGDLERDIASGRIIPLHQLISNTGPDINQNVNLYYIHYWSLTHFLLHYRNGLYSKPYKELIALGGSPDGFRRLIGPPDRIQLEWYQYLVEQARIAADNGDVQAGP
ncbi:hypothetical protein GCM10027431_10730 [Lysobacter rhizosphaerae]